MDKRFFGTDGIRGAVGGHTINPDFFTRLGWALGRVMSQQGIECVLIGRDTRASGFELASALASGVVAAGLQRGAMLKLPEHTTSAKPQSCSTRS